MGHYQEIQTLYQATQNLWKSLNHITNIPEPAYISLIEIERAGKRLFWNVYKYGLTASTSAKYRNKIDKAAENLVENIYPFPDVAEKAQKPLNDLKNALVNYVPINLPAQEKKNIQPAQTKQTAEPGAAYTGRQSKQENKEKIDVKIEQPKSQEQSKIYNNPEDVIKNVLGRDIITFYSIPKSKWDLDKDLYESKGLQFVDGLGIVRPDQKNIAQKILNEKWVKTSNYGYLSSKEYGVLKGLGYI